MNLLNKTQLRVVAIGMAKRLASSLEFMRQEFNIYPNDTKQAMNSDRLKIFTQQAMEMFSEKNEAVNDLEDQIEKISAIGAGAITGLDDQSESAPGGRA